MAGIIFRPSGTKSSSCRSFHLSSSAERLLFYYTNAPARLALDPSGVRDQPVWIALFHRCADDVQTRAALGSCCQYPSRTNEPHSVQTLLLLLAVCEVR
jgi:hypothetical protein